MGHTTTATLGLFRPYRPNILSIVLRSNQMPLKQLTRGYFLFLMRGPWLGLKAIFGRRTWSHPWLFFRSSFLLGSRRRVSTSIVRQGGPMSDMRGGLMLDF